MDRIRIVWEQKIADARDRYFTHGDSDSLNKVMKDKEGGLQPSGDSHF